MDNQAVETILKDSGALLAGHFLLTSGKHSAQYMQCARILQYPDYASQLCQAIAKGFEGDTVDIVIGPAMGGIIVAYELARHLNAMTMFAERVDGKMVLKRFEGIAGKRIIVAEDVITTGGTVVELIELLKAMGGVIVGIAVLVDRSGAKANFGGIKLVSAYQTDIAAYEATICPICKEGLPLIKPGSRDKLTP